MNKTEDIVNVEIISLNGSCQGVGEIADGERVIIDGAIPGDLAEVQLVKRRGGMCKGKLLSFIRKSGYRSPARCAYYGICGGCQLQDIEYAHQLNLKHITLTQVLSSHAEMIQPVIGMTEPWNYRNKMEFAFGMKGDQVLLGLRKRGRYQEIVDLQECCILSASGNRARNLVRDFVIKKKISAWNPDNETGLFRYCVIRETYFTKQLMVNLVTSSNMDWPWQELVERLKDNVPELKTVVWSINTKVGESAVAEESQVIYGEGWIWEELEVGDPVPSPEAPSTTPPAVVGYRAFWPSPRTLAHDNNAKNNGGERGWFDQAPIDKTLSFRISPGSFFQTNSIQTQILYGVIRAIALQGKHQRIWDLCCGAGTIGQYLADVSEEIIGVEIVDSAIKDAIANAENNKIINCRYILADTRRWLKSQLLARDGLHVPPDLNYTAEQMPDLVIFDPPRGGVSPKVIKRILEIAAPRLIYVSCNPQNLNTDLGILSEKYTVNLIQPVDMFPHTTHVETVVELVLAEQVIPFT